MRPRSRDSFCSPTNFKSTLDYYPVFGATAKIDLAGSVIRRRKRNREWLFRLQWREKLHCSYPGELRVLTPFDERSKHFVKDYDSRDKRRAGKMSGQTWMIGADHMANLKRHVEL